MIRWSTTIVVVLLAAVAAVVSYRHAFEVVVANGESGFTAVLVPLTIDGLIFASSMVLLDAARRGLKVPKLARFTLALGILATLAANVAHGWAHGPVGAIVAAWPALALVLAYELLMGLIRRSASLVVNHHETRSVEVEAVEGESPSPQPTDVPAAPELSPAPTPVLTPAPDELFPVAALRFSEDLSEGRVPPLATIKKDLKVGQPRAKRIHTYLHLLAEVAR
ncbi:DUF2637 domain-containing protein [Nonomuraea sp. NPDC049141]|uniref:DUF2637 domain-containing protein n=1 Tax=Nonomuraea sp. NPDC049141 TaxID=3155500 RepID=UPI0033EDEA85